MHVVGWPEGNNKGGWPWWTDHGRPAPSVEEAWQGSLPRRKGGGGCIFWTRKFHYWKRCVCVFLLCLCLFDFSQSGIKLNQTESSPTLRFDIICLLAFWLPFFDGTFLFQPGYPHQIGATSPWTGTWRPAIGRAEQLQRPTKVERDGGDRHRDGYSHRHVINVAICGLQMCIYYIYIDMYIYIYTIDI